MTPALEVRGCDAHGTADSAEVWGFSTWTVVLAAGVWVRMAQAVRTGPLCFWAVVVLVQGTTPQSKHHGTSVCSSEKRGPHNQKAKPPQTPPFPPLGPVLWPSKSRGTKGGPGRVPRGVSTCSQMGGESYTAVCF